MQEFHLILLFNLALLIKSADFTWLGGWTVVSQCPSYCCCPQYLSAFKVMTRKDAPNKLYATAEFTFGPACDAMGINIKMPYIYLPWKEDTQKFDASTINSFNKMKRDVFRSVDVWNVSYPYNGECAMMELDQSKYHLLERGICPIAICRGDKPIFVNETARELDVLMFEEYSSTKTDYETYMKYWPIYETRKLSLTPYRKESFIEKNFHVIQLENFGAFKIYSIEKTRLKLGDSWKIRIWTEKDLNKLVEPYQDFVESLRTVDMVYNFAALLILQSEGGVIINPDALLIRSLDEFVHRYDYFIQAGFSTDQYFSKLFTNNQVFGARKGHPLLHDTIQLILKNYSSIIETYENFPYPEFCNKFHIKDPTWITHYGGQMHILSLVTTLWPYSYAFWNRSREDGNFIVISKFHFQPLDVNKPTTAAFALYNFFNLSSLRKIIDYDTGNLQLDSRKLSTTDSQRYLLFSWSYTLQNPSKVEPSPNAFLPRLLHLFMKELKQDIINLWQKVNPLWTIKPHVEPPTKWRCLRYTALLEEGGVVVDGDRLYPLYEFDELAHKYSFFAGLKDVKNRIYVDDSVMGAKKDHEILQEAFEKTCKVDINDFAYLTMVVYEKHDLEKNIVLPSGCFYGTNEHLDSAYTKLWVNE